MLPYDTGINSIDLLNQKCKCVFHDRSKRSECLLIAYHVFKRKSEQVLILPNDPAALAALSLHHIVIGRLSTGHEMCKNSSFVQWTSLLHVRISQKWSKVHRKVNFIIQKFFLLEVIFFLILLCWNHCVVLFKAKRKGKNFGQFFNVCCLQGVSYTTATRHPKTRQHNFLVATTDRSVVKNWC